MWRCGARSQAQSSKQKTDVCNGRCGGTRPKALVWQHPRIWWHVASRGLRAGHDARQKLSLEHMVIRQCVCAVCCACVRACARACCVRACMPACGLCVHVRARAWALGTTPSRKWAYLIAWTSVLRCHTSMRTASPWFGLRLVAGKASLLCWTIPRRYVEYLVAIVDLTIAHVPARALDSGT